MKEEHAGLGRKLEARGSATENRSSQTVTARDMFLELGMVSQPYDSSTQEDQMFKASLGFEKRERNKKKGCGGDWFLFCICSPPPYFSIPTSESKPFLRGVVCLLWCPSIHLPANVRMSLLYDRLACPGFPTSLLPWLRSFQCFDTLPKTQANIFPCNWNQNTPRQNISFQRSIAQSQGMLLSSLVKHASLQSGNLAVFCAR